MAQETEQIILDISVKYEDAIARLAEFTKAKKALEDENKALAKQMKEDNTLVDENTRKIVANKLAIAEQNKAISTTTRELQNNVKQQQALEGSVDSLRAELSNLTQAYNAMSRSQRESAEGQAFAQNMRKISDEIKEASGAVGNFRDNVGDYRNAITSALAGNNKYAASVMEIASNGVNLSGVLKGAMGSVKAFGLALKSLALNPVGAVIMVIATAVMAFKKGLESSEGSLQRFQTLLAPIGRLMDALLGLLQEGVDMYISFAEGVTEAAMAMSRWMEKIPLVGKYFADMNAAIDESIVLQQRENQLQLDSRKLLEDTAKTEMEVSELRNKAKDRENYTAEERKKMLDEAIAKERAIADEKKKLAQEEYDILKARAEWADNDAETNQKLSEALAKLYQEEKAYNDKVRELNEQRTTLSNEIAAEEKARHEEWKRRMEERARIAKDTATKEIDAIRQLVDSDIALMEEGAEKDRAIARTSAERDIEGLRERLATEENLTDTARAAINDLILNRQKQLSQELIQIDRDEQAQKIAETRELIQLRLDAVAEGSRAEHELKMQALDADMQAELSAVEGNEEKKAAVRAKYDKLRRDEEYRYNSETAQKQYDIIAQEWDIKINEAASKGKAYFDVLKKQNDEWFEAEKARIIAERDYKLNQEGLTEDERKQIITQANNDLEMLNRQRAENEVAIEEGAKNMIISIRQAKAYAVTAIAKGMQDALDAFAEDSKEIAIAQKALALVELAVSQGEAIVGVMRSAAKEPTMAMRIVNYAQGIAMILSSVGQATKIIKSAKFADGGLVTGPGTGTSDSIPAMLSKEECVMNYRATASFAPLLSAINTMTGGVPIQPVAQAGSEALGEEMLARAFARGAAEIRPVVAVSDIREVETQVDVIDNIARLGGNG